LNIQFVDDKTSKIFNSRNLLQKQHGPNRARLIERRLYELAAANTLEDMRHLPGNCHELHGDLKGILAVSLDGPYRLLFEPANEPRPAKPDGGLDWPRVTAIRILEVINYHD